MLKGIDLSQRVEFSFSDDTEEQKTVVVLRPLSGVEMAELSNFQQPDGKASITTEYIVKLLVKTIVEIRKWPFEISLITAQDKDKILEFINILSIKQLSEITQVLTNLNNLTGQEAKN